MKKLMFIGVFISFIVSGCSTNLERGIGYYDEKNYEMAIEELGQIQKDEDGYYKAQQYLATSRLNLALKNLAASKDKSEALKQVEIIGKYSNRVATEESAKKIAGFISNSMRRYNNPGYNFEVIKAVAPLLKKYPTLQKSFSKIYFDSVVNNISTLSKEEYNQAAKSIVILVNSIQDNEVWSDAYKTLFKIMDKSSSAEVIKNTVEPLIKVLKKEADIKKIGEIFHLLRAKIGEFRSNPEVRKILIQGLREVRN